MTLITGLISGCWDNRELNKLAIVSGWGFDRAKNGDYLISIQSIVPGLVKGSTGMSGSDIQKPITPMPVEVDHCQGNTIFEALNRYTTRGSRTLFFPHTRIIVFGKKVARQGLYPLVEAVFRMRESRPNTLLVVAEDEASQILAARDSIETIPALGIADEIELAGESSKYPVETSLDFANQLLGRTTAPILPIIGVFEATSSEGLPIKRVGVKGTAVFKGDKMVGELNERESRGLLWVIGKVKHGYLVTNTSSQEKSTFLIVGAQNRIDPMIEGDRIKITIVITEHGNLMEYKGPGPLNPKVIKSLQDSAADAIKSEVLAALNKSRTLNADFFGFGEIIHRKYKNKWKTLEPRWNEIYPNIEITLNVKSEFKNFGEINSLAIQD